MALVKPVHALAKKLPSYEDHDLAQQMRRASKSIPSNIAEGFSKRRSAKDFKLYLAHALGSANELLVHFRVALELGYIRQEEASQLIEGYSVICRQLSKFIQN